MGQHYILVKRTDRGEYIVEHPQEMPVDTALGMLEFAKMNIYTAHQPLTAAMEMAIPGVDDDEEYRGDNYKPLRY